VLKLIWSLPSYYQHIKFVLIYGNETLSLEEVGSKIISEERRLKSEYHTSSNCVGSYRWSLRRKAAYCFKSQSLILNWMGSSSNCVTQLLCVIQIRHLRYKCHDGAMSEKRYE
jgi:hypothetical protein